MKQHAFGLEVKADDFVLTYMQFKHTSKQAFVYPAVMNRETKGGIAQDDNWDVISLESSEYDDSSRLDFSLFPQIHNTTASAVHPLPATSSSAASSSSSGSSGSSGMIGGAKVQQVNTESMAMTAASQSHNASNTNSYVMNSFSPRLTVHTEAASSSSFAGNGHDTPGSRQSTSSINTTPNHYSASSSKGPIKLSKPAIPLRGPVTSTPNFLMKPVTNKGHSKDSTPASLRKNLIELSGKPLPKPTNVSSPSHLAVESVVNKQRSDSITSEMPDACSVLTTNSQESILLPIEIATGDAHVTDETEEEDKPGYIPMCTLDETSIEAVVENSREEYLTFAKTVYRVSEDVRTAAQQLLFQPSLRPPLARSITPQSRSSTSTPVEHDISPESAMLNVSVASSSSVPRADCSTPTNRSQVVDEIETHNQSAKYNSPMVSASSYNQSDKEYSTAKAQLLVSKTPMEINGIAVQETLLVDADFTAQPSSDVATNDTGADTVDADSVDTQPQNTSQEEEESGIVEMDALEVADADIATAEEIVNGDKQASTSNVAQMEPDIEIEEADEEGSNEEVEAEAEAEEEEQEEEEVVESVRNTRNKRNSKKSVPSSKKKNESTISKAGSTKASSKPPLHPRGSRSSSNSSGGSSHESNVPSGRKRSRATVDTLPEQPPPRRSRPQNFSIQNKRDAIFGSWPTRKQSAASGSWTI